MWISLGEQLLAQEPAQLKAFLQKAGQLEHQGLGWLQSLGVLGGGGPD